AQRRQVRARPGRHLRAVEAHGVLQGPGRRLDDTALDLVGHAVRVDDLPGARRRHHPRDAHETRFALDLDVGGHGAVAGEVLVPGEREAATPLTVTLGARSPPGALSGRLDDGAGAGVVQVTQAELP